MYRTLDSYWIVLQYLLDYTYWIVLPFAATNESQEVKSLLNVSTYGTVLYGMVVASLLVVSYEKLLLTLSPVSTSTHLATGTQRG